MSSRAPSAHPSAPRPRGIAPPDTPTTPGTTVTHRGTSRVHPFCYRVGGVYAVVEANIANRKPEESTLGSEWRNANRWLTCFESHSVCEAAMSSVDRPSGDSNASVTLCILCCAQYLPPPNRPSVSIGRGGGQRRRSRRRGGGQRRQPLWRGCLQRQQREGHVTHLVPNTCRG